MSACNPRGILHGMGRRRLLDIAICAAFLLFFFGPLANLLLLAFSDEYLYPSFLPSALSLKWWTFVLSQGNLVGAMALSFLVAVATTAVSLLVCLPAAYAFARFQFPLRRFFLFSFLFTNAFPKIGLYVVIGIIFYRLNLMGTFPGVIIIHLINTMMFMTWIPAGSFGTIHREQEEAARDAGATPLQTFLHVTLPMALPGILVACLFTFLGSLEEAQGTLLVGMPTIKTVPVVMYSVIFDYPATAGAVFSIILFLPTLLLLLVARRSIGVNELSAGMGMR